MKVWKITTNDGYSLVKCFYRGLDNSSDPYKHHKYLLRYNLNKITTPKIGKIFAFMSPLDAFCYLEKIIENQSSRFNFRSSDFCIYVGEAENIGHQKFVSLELYKLAIENFWKTKIKKKKLSWSEIGNAPIGTITCSSFKPEKKYTYNRFYKFLKSNKKENV